MSSPPVISALPAVPATSDPNFETLAPALFTAIKNTFISEVNAVASWINAGNWLTTPPVFDSCTILGNLTVDTNTLFVDAANNRVGINQFNPQHYLDIYAALNGSGYAINIDSTTRIPSDVIFNITGTSGTSIFNVQAGGTTSASSLNLTSNLSVAGNLTVDTNTLFVDAATNRVVLGATTGGAERLSVFSGDAYQISFKNNSTPHLGAVGVSGSGNFLIYNGGSAAKIDSSFNLSVGGQHTALGKLDSRATSGAQIVASYDNSNSTGITTNSSGDCTISPTGDGLTLDADDIRINQTPAGTAGAATGTYARINFNGTYYKLALLADS